MSCINLHEFRPALLKVVAENVFFFFLFKNEGLLLGCHLYWLRSCLVPFCQTQWQREELVRYEEQLAALVLHCHVAAVFTVVVTTNDNKSLKSLHDPNLEHLYLELSLNHSIDLLSLSVKWPNVFVIFFLFSSFSFLC